MKQSSGLREILINARSIKAKAGKAQLMLLAMEDTGRAAPRRLDNALGRQADGR